MIIVVIKYSGDILDVFVRDRGHLEYNAQGNTEGVKEHPKRKEKNDNGAIV